MRRWWRRRRRLKRMREMTARIAATEAVIARQQASRLSRSERRRVARLVARQTTRDL